MKEYEDNSLDEYSDQTRIRVLETRLNRITESLRTIGNWYISVLIVNPVIYLLILKADDIKEIDPNLTEKGVTIFLLSLSGIFHLFFVFVVIGCFRNSDK